MTEEPKEKQSEDYQFINEKIVPKKKSKWKKKLGTTLFVIFLAVIFGVVAQAAFLLSGNYLKKWFGMEEKRQEVVLPKPTTQPRNTMTPTPKPPKNPTPTPTKIPVSVEPTEVPEGRTPTPEVTATPVTPGGILSVTEVPKEEEQENPVTPEPTKAVESGNAENGEKPEDGMTSTNYLQVYDTVRKVAEEVSDAFVTVEAIEQGVDWFQEVYEKRTRTTGLVLGNDGIDLLILVGTEQFARATAIEVIFGEEVISGRIYSMDTDFGLAIIAVPLENLSEEILEEIQLGLLADEEDISVGTPVIALGAPNGYENSVEFGMITSLGSTVPVTDGEVAYFTTNIMEYPNGFGYVVSMDGKILGLITHTHKENPKDGIFSAVSLDSVRGVIVKLLNNAERCWFGIKGQNVPKNLAKEYTLEAGVYVGEVENASPALSAGIKAGDILAAIGDEPVAGIREFSEKLLEQDTRAAVTVTLLRKTEDGLKEMVVEVILMKKEQN